MQEYHHCLVCANTYQRSFVMDVKSVIGLYLDKTSQTHNKNKYNSQNKVRHFRKGILNDAIRTDEHLKILDAETGTIFPALLFAETRHNITGKNSSGDTLEKARHNTGKLIVTMDFMHNDVENLPVEDETLNIVINRHLLRTLPNPEITVDNGVAL
ncbi:MAG: methyltransferase domain-containing protein [Methanosarcinales archaeon]|nr:MAG: methyltransferase domain-containing protein [Methanosarcinales archaeon]